ncbi:MAG TPA: DUF2249 domain-containing protein [Candidatus Saccharimonadales bacterium]|nr:DUF2249 domain-containing protein [Candidatus Saccharimonadales bacterium]
MTDAALERLTSVLIRAVRQLGDAGRPEDASGLAADGWAIVRHDQPRSGDRLNGVMYYLARLIQAEQDTERSNSMTQDPVLDVRSEPPVRRHSLIFETYAALGPGAGFQLVNDHDPKPLYYQFAAEQAGNFSWDYLEQGPEVWRVRIGRVGAPVAAHASDASSQEELKS